MKTIICPKCKGSGADPDGDPNDWPMAAVTCGLCWGKQRVAIAQIRGTVWESKIK